MNKHLELWESVRTPDPAYTKGFSRGGGFKGTATSATYLIRRATELWGPMGGAWGVEVDAEQVVEGPALYPDNPAAGRHALHIVRIRLRHPGGFVPAYGQTTLVGTNRNGAFMDEEAPKKSMTDALTKAMSWLGFAADVHMGLFDDIKYVEEARRAFAEPPPPPPAPAPVADMKVAEDSLREAAKFGLKELEDTFKGLPPSKALSALWKSIGAELKKAAEEADAAALSAR